MVGFTDTFLSINSSYHQAPFSSSCFSTTLILFQTKHSQSAHYFQIFRLSFTLFGNGSGNENVISAQRATNLQAESRPNQSLKLTEVAIDDFAARWFAENDMVSRYVRATNNMELTVRRRSLAPVR